MAEDQKVRISGFLVFFLIHAIQVGVGILGFQRLIVKSAGNDAWIAVIFAGITTSVIIWFMYGLLKNEKNKDLNGIHRKLFGKWFGGLLNLIWVLYWLMLGLTIIRSYIEVVSVWMFPHINVIVFSFILLLLVYYGISGGFRVVAGICFLGVVIPFYLALTFLFPIEYTNFRNLLPVWNHSINEMAIATKDMGLSYLGFSTLLMYYPYIKHPEKSQKWAQLGNILTTLVYMFLIIISICYFSEGQLDEHIWATLSMWKIVEMPIVERFEYVGITSWVLVILPNISLAVWAALKVASGTFKIKEKKILIFMMVFLYVGCIFIEGKEKIDQLSNLVTFSGLLLVYLYVPCLLLYSKLMSKIRRN
ncbi:GerAB/ArcD/ProY family transporter [Metabacillus bambusae]|uniref:GerAB/ArcD/ProY family transporter n=1 Tax=Metabacillus bambusae TaxID=2795218 RepID=A0ABS3N868_9BACI|nr:GerAB/ArcD/ProY family transporter [Metabacillus bambusae]MBO1514459.1 GerAB/ArcD/ProY family transporter [Metabacillus bambusae]